MSRCIVCLSLYFVCTFNLKGQTQVNLDSLLAQSIGLSFTELSNSQKIADYVIENDVSGKLKQEAGFVKAQNLFLQKKYILLTEQFIQLQKEWKDNSKPSFLKNKILLSDFLDSLGLENQSEIVLNELYFHSFNQNEIELEVQKQISDSIFSFQKYKEIETKLRTSKVSDQINLKNKVINRLGNYFLTKNQLDSASFYFGELEKNPKNSYYYFLSKIGNANVLFKKSKFSESNQSLEELLLSDSDFRDVFLEEMYRMKSQNHFSLGEMESYVENHEKYVKLAEAKSNEIQKSRIKILDLLESDAQLVKKDWLAKWRWIFYGSIGILIVVLLGVIGLFIRIKTRQKRISDAQKNKDWMDASRKEIEAKLQEEKNIPFVIPEKTEGIILEKLQEFEVSKQFLKPELSLSSLAKELNSNTTYLSEIINKHKGRNFKSYVNELRVNYIVEKIKTEKQYRTYKISYLAEEAGFVSRTSFASIFKSVTGVTPSAFIESFQNESDYEN